MFDKTAIVSTERVGTVKTYLDKTAILSTERVGTGKTPV